VLQQIQVERSKYPSALRESRKITLLMLPSTQARIQTIQEVREQPAAPVFGSCSVRVDATACPIEKRTDLRKPRRNERRFDLLGELYRIFEVDLPRFQASTLYGTPTARRGGTRSFALPLVVGFRHPVWGSAQTTGSAAAKCSRSRFPQPGSLLIEAIKDQ
jgi:hypothetical protein